MLIMSCLVGAHDPLHLCLQGLTYLLTFLFAANTVGLTGLAIQLVLFPDMDLDGPKPQPRAGAELPKVSTPRVLIAVFADNPHCTSCTGIDLAWTVLMKPHCTFSFADGQWV